MGRIGNNLNKLRTQSGKTPQEIANAIKVSKKTYENWEKNITEPGLSYAYLLAKEFGATIQDIFGVKCNDCPEKDQTLHLLKQKNIELEKLIKHLKNCACDWCTEHKRLIEELTTSKNRAQDRVDILLAKTERLEKQHKSLNSRHAQIVKTLEKVGMHEHPEVAKLLKISPSPE